MFDKSVDVKLNVISPTTRQLPPHDRERTSITEKKKVTRTGENSFTFFLSFLCGTKLEFFTESSSCGYADIMNWE